jgi:hypothetical protein
MRCVGAVGVAVLAEGDAFRFLLNSCSTSPSLNLYFYTFLSMLLNMLSGSYIWFLERENYDEAFGLRTRKRYYGPLAMIIVSQLWILDLDYAGFHLSIKTVAIMLINRELMDILRPKTNKPDLKTVNDNLNFSRFRMAVRMYQSILKTDECIGPPVAIYMFTKNTPGSIEPSIYEMWP